MVACHRNSNSGYRQRWNRSHPVLILAVSGRALAQRAIACGYRVLVADCYMDRETRQVASAWVKIPHVASANDWRQGVAQLLKSETSPAGLIFGSGFENRPHLIAELSFSGKLLGNTPRCIRLVKDPGYFFPLLWKLAIPAPETRLTPPAKPLGWLRKAIGGTGGYHVLPTTDSVNSPCYYQRKLEGQPGSVLFLANGKEAQALGYHSLWIAPTPTAPYRYGGIAAPLNLAPSVITLLQNYLHAIVAATGLCGLNGLDFIQTPDGVQVLEINPRPPASLELYQDFTSLFDAHIHACQGGFLPLSPVPATPARAFSILYAPSRLQIPSNIVWPAFCRDQPIGPGIIEQEEPVCSVHATGVDIAACQQLIARRQRQLLTLLSPKEYTDVRRSPG